MSCPDLRLISHKLCPYVQRARIVLIEKGVPHEVQFIDLANKPDWFADISPLGKVPVLLVDGRPLFESAVIAEYIDDLSPGSLHPEDIFEKARNRSWIEVASAILATIARFYRAPDRPAFEQAADRLRLHFRAVEEALGDGPWFNGGYFSMVDAAFGPVFRYFELIDKYLDIDLFADTPRVNAWRRALARRPSIINAVVGDYRERLRGFIAGLDSELGRVVTTEGSCSQTHARLSA